MISRFASTIGVALALALSGITADAADLGGSDPVEGSQPISWFSGPWAGVYFGGSVGGLQADLEGAPNPFTAGTYNTNINGAVFGLQAGVNLQIQQFVFGLEGDISWGDVAGSTALSPILIADGEMNYFATIRGRVGIAFNRVLAYATGGYAVASITGQFRNVPPSDTKVHGGYAIGGGVEVLLTDHISVKAEGLYFDLDRQVYAASGGIGTGDPNNGSVFRAGVNIHF